MEGAKPLDRLPSQGKACLGAREQPRADQLAEVQIVSPGMHVRIVTDLGRPAWPACGISAMAAPQHTAQNNLNCTGLPQFTRLRRTSASR
jgi:hypothetical protein